MRRIDRKRKNKQRKLILTISIFLIVLLVVPAYAYLQKQLDINGKTSILVVDDEVCEGNITYDIENWKNGEQTYYKISFTIYNNSAKDYNFWDVYFDVPADASLVSYSSSEAQIIGSRVKASNAVYNGIIKSGESTKFEIQLGTIEENYEPTNITINNCSADTSDNSSSSIDNLLVDFKVTNSYGTYTYQYDVTVTNTSDTNIQGWSFSIEKPENTTLTNAWNINYIVKDSTIEFSNVDHNNLIEANKSVTFGMVITTDDINYVPQIVN